MQKLILATLLGAALAPAQAVDKIAVTVQHDLAIARPSETISIPWKEVNAAMPGAQGQRPGAPLAR